MDLLLTTRPRRVALLDELQDAQPTYAEVGATASWLPPDAHPLRRTIAIGRGDRVFHRAAEALLGWRMHHLAGLDVVASTSTAQVGTTVLVTFVRGLPIGLSAPCRVVDVVDTEDHRGFTYGTLPGHPESGEERFEVSRGADGTVRLQLVAFSRHATAMTRAIGPAASLGQRLVTHRYVHAVRRAAAGW